MFATSRFHDAERGEKLFADMATFRRSSRADRLRGPGYTIKLIGTGKHLVAYPDFPGITYGGLGYDGLPENISYIPYLVVW
jgi:hypothetical protein